MNPFKCEFHRCVFDGRGNQSKESLRLFLISFMISFNPKDRTTERDRTDLRNGAGQSRGCGHVRPWTLRSNHIPDHDGKWHYPSPHGEAGVHFCEGIWSEKKKKVRRWECWCFKSGDHRNKSCDSYGSEVMQCTFVHWTAILFSFAPLDRTWFSNYINCVAWSPCVLLNRRLGRPYGIRRKLKRTIVNYW